MSDFRCDESGFVVAAAGARDSEREGRTALLSRESVLVRFRRAQPQPHSGLGCVAPSVTASEKWFCTCIVRLWKFPRGSRTPRCPAEDGKGAIQLLSPTQARVVTYQRALSYIKFWCRSQMYRKPLAKKAC
jgi:hypothetical protein